MLASVSQWHNIEAIGPIVPTGFDFSGRHFTFVRLSDCTPDQHQNDTHLKSRSYALSRKYQTSPVPKDRHSSATEISRLSGLTRSFQNSIKSAPDFEYFMGHNRSPHHSRASAPISQRGWTSRDCDPGANPDPRSSVACWQAAIRLASRAKPSSSGRPAAMGASLESFHIQGNHNRLKSLSFSFGQTLEASG